MKKKLWTLFMSMLMVLGSFFFACKPATAQTGTTVFFLPDPANVYLNGSNSQVVELWVGEVVEMNGFDITVEYDPTVARLEGWAVGNFLELAGGCFIPPGSTDQPGYFRRACVQLAKPLKTGSGALLRFTFSGLNQGSSELTFENPLVTLGNPPVKFAPMAVNSTLNVTYNATIKPTTLSGSFDLQGRTDRGGIPVTLSKGQYVLQGPYTTGTTNVGGNNLAFTDVAMDVYTVSTGQAGYLNIDANCGKTKAVFGTTTTLSQLKLKGGNAVWTDNEINMQDISKVLGVYGKASTLAAPLDADINANGTVDVYDLAMAAGNYGLTCATAYANWVP